MEDLRWRKSSHSGNGGATCVELAFIKSSYSGNGGMDCVELAPMARSQKIAIRDSKQPNGPQHRFSIAVMAALIAKVKSGQYDI